MRASESKIHSPRTFRGTARDFGRVKFFSIGQVKARSMFSAGDRIFNGFKVRFYDPIHF